MALVVAAAGGGLLWTAFGSSGTVGPSSSTAPTASSTEFPDVGAAHVVPWSQVPPPPRGYGFDMSGWAGQGIARVVDSQGGHPTLSDATAALTGYTATLKTQGWVATWDEPVKQHGALGDPGCYGGGRAFSKAGTPMRLWVFSGGCLDQLRFTVFRGPLSVVRLAPGQTEGTLIGPPGPASGIEQDLALERAWEEMSEADAASLTLTFGVSNNPATGLARGSPGWDAEFHHVCQITDGPVAIGSSPVGTSASPAPSSAPSPDLRNPCIWGDAGVLLDGANGAFVVGGFSSR